MKPKNRQNKKNKNIKILKFQFCISIFFIIIIIIITISNSINKSKEEEKSSEILSNYNMMRLFSSINNSEKKDLQYSSINDSEENNSKLDNNNILKNSIKQNNSKNSNEYMSNIIGTIEIKKINLYYPIFSGFSENLLKKSPCRFYGPDIGEIGNLCIAGHNYDNDKFFSKISKLEKNDEITLVNSFNFSFSYYVQSIYEVDPNNLSPIYNYNKNIKNLTLITCNNFNNNRIIIRAIIK